MNQPFNQPNRPANPPAAVARAGAAASAPVLAGAAARSCFPMLHPPHPTPKADHAAKRQNRAQQAGVWKKERQKLRRLQPQHKDQLQNGKTITAEATSTAAILKAAAAATKATATTHQPNQLTSSNSNPGSQSRAEHTRSRGEQSRGEQSKASRARHNKRWS